MSELKVSRENPIQSLSIIIPSYNEAATLETFVNSCLALKGVLARELQIIIVDDGSQDDSLNIARRLSIRNEGIDLVSHAQNRGIGEALLSGYKMARGKWITHLPADMQFDPIHLTYALPFLNASDIVFLYRTDRKDVGGVRRFISGMNRRVNRFFFGLFLRDINWVKLYRSWVVREIDVKSRSSFVESERVIRAFKKGARISELPAPHNPRQKGKGLGARPKAVFMALLDFVRLVLSPPS